MKLLKVKNKWVYKTRIVGSKQIFTTKDHKEPIYIVELTVDEYYKLLNKEIEE